ncbi:MAG: hypothetical protein QF797_19415 [Alphaproteobacteria bacterium]|nr:hypothetical protein [Alphaproteobacteria bacterium]
MRLNLGCGHDRLDGYHNVDIVPDSGADEVVDLEALPWPWTDNAAEEVLLKHVLEHLGREPEVYLGIIKELWRVCRPGATVTVIVPHPRHDHFLNDPTHVRPITPQGLELFSARRNREWQAKGFGNTPLGLQTGVDFELISVNLVPDEIWRRRLENSEISEVELAQAARQLNNVIAESQIVLRAIKVDG